MLSVLLPLAAILSHVLHCMQKKKGVLRAASITSCVCRLHPMKRVLTVQNVLLLLTFYPVV